MVRVWGKRDAPVRARPARLVSGKNNKIKNFDIFDYENVKSELICKNAPAKGAQVTFLYENM